MIFTRPDQVKNGILWVVTPVFNPVRYRSRWRLYMDFEKRVEEAGARLMTVEVAFGDREFAVTSPGHQRHLCLRTASELWLKENAVNLAVQRLPSDWKYVAWVDADVTFARDDWANETLHRLQHHDVVQMFTQSAHLSATEEIMGTSGSIMGCHAAGEPTAVKPVRSASNSYPYGWADPKRPPGTYPHPGYAWAMTRRAWDALGGLIDFAILGGADWHMAHALLGQVDFTIGRRYSAEYVRRMRQWQRRAEAHVKRNVGAVDGLVLHHWHGPKASRAYATRTDILSRHKFDPRLDLKRDWQGLWQLTERSPGLRDDIRAYFGARNEDALS